VYKLNQILVHQMLIDNNQNVSFIAILEYFMLIRDVSNGMLSELAFILLINVDFIYRHEKILNLTKQKFICRYF